MQQIGLRVKAGVSIKYLIEFLLFEYLMIEFTSVVLFTSLQDERDGNNFHFVKTKWRVYVNHRQFLAVHSTGPSSSHLFNSHSIKLFSGKDSSLYILSVTMSKLNLERKGTFGSEISQ